MVTVAELVQQVKDCIKKGTIDPNISFKDFCSLLKGEFENYLFKYMLPIFPHWIEDESVSKAVSGSCLANLPIECLVVALRSRKFSNDDLRYMIRDREIDGFEEFLKCIAEYITESVVKLCLQNGIGKEKMAALSQYVDFSQYSLSDTYCEETMGLLIDYGAKIGDVKQLYDTYSVYESFYNSNHLLNKLVGYGVDGAELAKYFYRQHDDMLDMVDELVEMGYQNDLF